MDAITVLTAILIIAATAACVAVIWLTREVAATARATTQLTDEVRERLIPLLEKADVTVDAANAELLRIDGAITRFEEASERVSAASSTLADVVQAPADLVTGVADRMRRAWKERRQNAAAGADQGTDTQAEAPPSDGEGDETLEDFADVGEPRPEPRATEPAPPVTDVTAPDE